MDGLQSIDFFRDSISRNLMNQMSKTGILLWWPTDHRKRPNCIFLVLHVLHLHQWKRVWEAIIANMVTEWIFGFIVIRIYRTSNHKISIRRNAKPVVIIKIPKTPIA